LYLKMNLITVNKLPFKIQFDSLLYSRVTKPLFIPVVDDGATCRPCEILALLWHRTRGQFYCFPFRALKLSTGYQTDCSLIFPILILDYQGMVPGYPCLALSQKVSAGFPGQFTVSTESLPWGSVQYRPQSTRAH